MPESTALRIVLIVLLILAVGALTMLADQIQNRKDKK